MEENNENLLEYYKEAYDMEKQRGSELAEELADANAKAAELIIYFPVRIKIPHTVTFSHNLIHRHPAFKDRIRKFSFLCYHI